jgi:hypothetical protein
MRNYKDDEKHEFRYGYDYDRWSCYGHVIVCPRETRTTREIMGKRGELERGFQRGTLGKSTSFVEAVINRIRLSRSDVRISQSFHAIKIIPISLPGKLGGLGCFVLSRWLGCRDRLDMESEWWAETAESVELIPV